MNTLHLEQDIVIHFVELERIFALPKANFDSLREYQQAKKSQIHQYRLEKLSDFSGQTILASDMLVSNYGKPYLDFLFFNHSHSQKHYALAMSKTCQDLGVDIEDLDRKVRFETLAQHAFHADEMQLWQQNQQEKTLWFKIWTAKEAVLKASGLGIRLNLSQLNTQVDPQKNIGFCAHPQIGQFKFQHIEYANCMLTVAWRV